MLAFLPSLILERLGMRLPIIQAPMAGISTPAMAAAVAEAGGLGSLGVGAMTARAARGAIDEFVQRSGRALNVNLFVHQPARERVDVEAAWLKRLEPEFVRFGGEGMLSSWMLGGAGMLFGFSLGATAQVIPAVAHMATSGVFDRVPGLKLVGPSTPADAKALLRAAIRDDLHFIRESIA